MWRRVSGLVLAGCLVACTGGGSDESAGDEERTVDGEDVTSDTADEPDAAEAGGPGAGSTTSVPPSTTTTVPPVVVTPLPGLLDTTDVAFPNDTAVRTGELANGLRYYVRYNDQPGTRASLRLAIDGGSVDELGPETGVAHFAEHMLFNGTTAYPENQLIDVLRSFGADFGPDINAYTSYGETVYKLEVPNDDGSIGEAMNVLGEWLSEATIDPDQVVAERGVVLDEWRVRTQSVSGRLFGVAQDLYLAGTPYEGRSPIGERADIEAMSPETLRGFYDAWYRPDNAAVVVVGDIDVDDIVARIEDTFGPAQRRGDAPADGSSHTFDLDLEPDFALHADPDQATVDVEVTLPLPAIEGEGTLAARAGLLDEVIFEALVRRLDRDLAAGAAPFDRVVTGSNSIVDELDAPALYAFTDAARAEDTLIALLTEYERAYRHGFTDDEIAAAVESVRAEWDAYLERENEIQDRNWADALVAHFLAGDPYPLVRDEYELVVAELDAISAEAAGERFAARWTNSAPHVIISAPETSVDELPGRDDVLAAIERVPTVAVDQREPPRVLPDTLMERPDPVAVPGRKAMTEHTWAQLDPWLYEFANGARVVLNPNTIAQGSVFFEATSPGGSSLVADADAIDALYAADVVMGSGVAGFDPAEFAEIVSTSAAEVGASITPYAESMYGETSSGDAETLFQMVHLYMTQPRFDPVALNQVVQRNRPVVLDPSIEPGTASWDALAEARHGDEPRHAVLPTPEQFDTLDLDGVERVWRDRFGDASDWVFVFSGDLDRSEFERLAASYIGTLPGARGTEVPVPVGSDVPEGVTAVEVRAGSGDTATVEMLFSTPVGEVSPRNEALTTVASAVLDARLTRVVRETFGDSYSPFIQSYLTADPDPTVDTYVRVTGAPDRIGVIAETVIGEIADIAGGGLGDDEFTNAYLPVEEDYSFVHNGEYLRELTRELLIADYDFDGYVFEADVLAAIDRSATVDFIARTITTDRYVMATTTPR